MSDGKKEVEETRQFSLGSPPWVTPMIGLVMLLVGLAAGYFGRPLLSSEEKAPEIAATAPPASADVQQLMEFLGEETRHFIGDPDAPVTIIEFSDFQ